MVHVALDMMRVISTKQHRSNPKGDLTVKKLLVFALGLGIALGTVSFLFAQDTTTTTKKMKKKKKSGLTDTTATKRF